VGEEGVEEEGEEEEVVGVVGHHRYRLLPLMVTKVAVVAVAVAAAVAVQASVLRASSLHLATLVNEIEYVLIELGYSHEDFFGRLGILEIFLGDSGTFEHLHQIGRQVLDIDFTCRRIEFH
jgi:hypothetical protein